MRGQYHITDDNVIKECEARLRCPFRARGHYPTLAQAESVLRDIMGHRTVPLAARKVAPTAPVFNEDGLTDNVQDFKNDLETMAFLMRTYGKYRKTGLNEARMVPVTPAVVAPYVNEQVIARAWRMQDYARLAELFREAYKLHYLRNRFTPEDIDCLLDDDAIEAILLSRSSGPRR